MWLEDSSDYTDGMEKGLPASLGLLFLFYIHSEFSLRAFRLWEGTKQIILAICKSNQGAATLWQETLQIPSIQTQLPSFTGILVLYEDCLAAAAGSLCF